jgi:hypothetical protein
MGRPKETNRPDTVFSLSTRAGEKRSGPAWPTAQGHFGPARPRRGHDDDHGATAARAAGRRPLPAMTEYGEVRTGSARGRRTRQGNSKGKRNSEDTLPTVRSSATAP